MQDKYYFYMQWLYTQLNGGINKSVPSQKCEIVRGDGRSKFSKKPSKVLGYAAIDEIGICYDNLLTEIYKKEYSSIQRRSICIHTMLHELSHLSQHFFHDPNADFEMANDLNVLSYMTLNDYDIRMKCGEYDLDFIEDLILSKWETYKEKYGTNKVPKYHYVKKYEDRLPEYLESRMNSEIPDFVKNFQIRYYNTEYEYITWAIKDGVKVPEKNVINALNFIVHNSMLDHQITAYHKVHMDQNTLYFDTIHNFLYQKMKQQFGQKVDFQ